MFPFGSLLTQIPLILIGALYMLYLGFYAVNKSKDIIAAADSEVKEQHVALTPDDVPNNYYLFKISAEDKNDAVEGKSSGVEFYESYLDLEEVIPVWKTYSHYCSYCLFSRPPPSV